MRASRRTGNEKRYSLHLKWAMGEPRTVYNKALYTCEVASHEQGHDATMSRNFNCIRALHIHGRVTHETTGDMRQIPFLRN